MKKYLFTIIFYVASFSLGYNQDCGFSGEADRTLGANPCIYGCISGYEQCENYYNSRYRAKLEAMAYETLDMVCGGWLQSFTGIFGEYSTGPDYFNVCDSIWGRTADIDGEHFTNLQIAINLLNRCVNTCDGKF